MHQLYRTRMELNVENVMKSSREHKRCGTSFLLIVMVVSVIVHMFIRVESSVLGFVIRILLLPVIAGISYELIRLAGEIGEQACKSFEQAGHDAAAPDDARADAGYGGGGDRFRGSSVRLEEIFK